MKRTKKFLAMAITAIMLMTMVPFTSAIAVEGVTEVQVGSLKRTATDSTRESYVSYAEKQAEGETFILRYTYNALTGNNNPNLTSGIILINTANASGYMGLITSNDNKHFLFSNGYQGAYNAGYSKEFTAVTNEPVSAAAMFTRTATGTDIKLLMNGVEVTSASFNGYYIHTSEEGNGFWNRMRAAAGTSVDGKMYDLGTLTQTQKSELIAEYNASVSVADGVNDVIVSGNGVDGKILAGFKMSLRNNMTVDELKNKLVVPTGAALSVYADGSATEPLSGSATVSEGAVVKTTSSNGYTKLEYPISVNDPMNMVWDTYKDTTPSVNTWKSFGRAQEDGETVAIHYTYNAEPCTLHASHPAGLMLSGGTWNTNNGVFMSNRTAHFLRESSGNANTGNAITTFPAKDGEPMDVVAFVTRKGNGSETQLVVNGTKLEFANAQGGLWSKITYADKYIGSGFTHMGIWENTKIYAEVESLGVLSDEVRTNTINGYCANVTAKNAEVTISGNSNNNIIVSDYKLTYFSNDITTEAFLAKLNLPTGASCEVFESAAATVPLASTDAVATGAVLKVTSANGLIKISYPITVTDPINTVWDTYKDALPGVNTWKRFGRAQEDGETVVIHYTYNAEPCSLHASHPAGLMLSGGTWDTNKGVFMSNREKHFLRESTGNANWLNAITTFPAKDGEPMDVVAFVTRKGNGSETELVVNGTKIEFENEQGILWSKITYTDKYIGSGFTHMGIWENTKIYAEVESLGVLDDEVRANTINGYCANVAVTSMDVGPSGNSNYELIVSDYKLSYLDAAQTPGKLMAKLSIPIGANGAVYESAAAATPLASTDAIGEGAVLKVTSANEKFTITYALSEYTNENIIFVNEENGDVTVKISELFTESDNLYLAAYVVENGATKLAAIKQATLEEGVLSATLTAEETENAVVKALYWTTNLFPIISKIK